MRKVLLALVVTAVGLGLLLSFKSRPGGGASALGGTALSGTGTSPKTQSTPSTAPSSGGSSNGGSSNGGTQSSPSTSSGGRGGSASGTYTGTAEDTRYGLVQVQAVVASGKLTDVTVLEVPDNGGYEDQIVQSALPQLKSEALSAQSANIDIVSGATYTSQGYAQSLQSALDQAGM